jgi:signal transduction histidine kinase
MGKAISGDLDIQSILQKVTDATTQLTNASFGAFFHNVINEQGESYKLYTLSGASKEAFEGFGMPRNTAVFHPTFTGEGIVRIDDITKDPRYGKNPPHYGMPKGHLPVASYLAVPVISKSGSVLGGLFFGHPEPARFSADHEQLISAIAAQTAVALDNAKLYEEIKLLNAKKDEFIGLASHELKTPVTSVSGYLQIIEQSFANEDRNKIFISKARSQVNKLAALISDLLDVSKIQTGKLPLSYSAFDLAGLLKEVTEVMQQTNPLHQIILNCDEANLTIEADYQRIEQVLINLISNAVKYSPDADRVIVSACAAGDKVRVSIQDFGIGIEPEQQKRIFSRFFRVENLAAHMSGLGIGLYISQEIVKRHHGKLWVKSAAGKGSTFLFEVPVKQVG